METVKVYRYERPNGKAPYSTISSIYDELNEKHSLGRHPGWYSDFEFNEDYSDYFSGCDSKKSLVKWFWGFNKDLKKEGFSIKEYEVPIENVEIGKSNKQLRFKRI